MASVYETFPDMAHLPLAVAGPIGGVASNMGLPADQLRFVLCLVLSLPLGLVHRALGQSVGAKHAFSLVTGLVYCWFVTGVSGALHPLFSSLVVYAICRYGPRKSTPGLVFLFAMAYMSASHIYRLYSDYLGWNLDYTTAQMIVTVKVCMFAYNVSDGAALNAGERLSAREGTHVFRSSRALTRFPSVLEFLSYVFFYGSVLSGPTFEMREYLDFTTGERFRRDKMDGPPPSWKPIGKQALKCVVFYGGVMMAGRFPIMGYVNTPAFLEETTFLYRIGYIIVAPAFFRYKYYFAWYLSEMGCLSAGLGYSGRNKDGSLRWDAVTNCHAMRVEFARSLPELTNNWNMGVNHWLKHYVYFRVEMPAALKGVMPPSLFNNLVTKMTSALWHGFYPAYYLFFVSAALVNVVDNEFRRIFRPMFFHDGPEDKAKNAATGLAYYAVSCFLTITFVNYLGMAFAMLRFDWSVAMWTSVYFYGHILCVLAIVVIKFTCPARRRPSGKKTDAAAAAAVAPAAAGGDAPSARTRSKSPGGTRKRSKKDL